MIVLLSIAFSIASASAACPSAPESLDRAEAAVLEFRTSDAEEALETVEAAFGCSPADAETLGRFHRAEGAMAFLGRDSQGARSSFAAARAIQPDVPPTGFGSKVVAAWEDAEPIAGSPARLTVAPVYGPVAIDLASTADTSDALDQVAPGLHLVQVFDGDGGVVFGRLVSMPGGTSIRVDTGLEPPPAPAPAPIAVQPVPTELPEEPTRKRTSPVWLGAGIGAGVLGTASMVVALDARSAGGKAEDVPSLDRAFRREQAFGYAAYGLFGLAATGVTLHIAL